MDWSLSSILAGLLVSTLGMAIFLYGKNVQRFWPLVVGLAMMTYPWFIYSALWLWVITGGLCVVLYVARERE